ncbi:MAG: succinate--CoA ligase subunit beta [Deltaproteobacteria bacterium]|jgi:succinyl-CoA synthetase beta subunit|nr:succinate--CoA ligase subunit beta [Deltaproteobacteria bacterium]
MNIHEYQAKEILARHGVKIPRGKVAFSLPEAEAAANSIGPGPFIVKAQIHAGGRGKGGGIRKAKNLAEIRKIGREMFGMNLVTPQTGPQGKPVNRILVEEALPVIRELYLGITIDRRAGRIAIMGSAAGGVDIEEVAVQTPEKIHTLLMEPGCGFTFFQGRKIALGMGLEGALIGEGAAMAAGLYRAFWENDCTLAEINPLVLTAGGELMALDAKMDFDDNALYRHPEILSMRDTEQEDLRDVEAARLGLHTYVNLAGNIGCIVNGAGLGMATLDLLHYYGGDAANFLDAGAGASKEVIQNAFTLLNSNPKVKGILINMFGGITRCDSYAQGVVDALREKPLRVPLVIRMEGTNVEMGRKILADSGLNILYAVHMREAAQKIIALAKKETPNES